MKTKKVATLIICPCLLTSPVISAQQQSLHLSTLPLFLRRGRGGNIRELDPCFPVLGPSRVQPIAARVTDPRSQQERSYQLGGGALWWEACLAQLMCTDYADHNNSQAGTLTLLHQSTLPPTWYLLFLAQDSIKRLSVMIACMIQCLQTRVVTKAGAQQHPVNNLQFQLGARTVHSLPQHGGNVLFQEVASVLS